MRTPLRFEGASDWTSIRVLLVEDSPEYADLVRTALARPSGYHFLLEHTGGLNCASECIDEQDYDAVLLDLCLSDGAEADTLEWARGLTLDMPVLVVTATESSDLARVAYRAGALDYLVKDRVRGGGLAEAILAAITLHRYRPERQAC